TMKSTVEDALKRVFNAENLNRVDDVIVLHPLEKRHIYQIIDILAPELLGRAESVGIEVELSKTAKDFLVEKGYDAKFGARPLRRAIQKYVEDPMAEAILGNDLAEGDVITLRYDEAEKPDALLIDLSKGTAKKKTTKAKAKDSAKTPPAADIEPETSEEASPEETAEEGAAE